MAEKQIVAAIMRYLKTVPHCFFWKTHGGLYGTAGSPDIVCCIEGRFVAFEVKTDTGKLSKIQESTIRKIIAAKGKAYKVTSVEDVKFILKTLEVALDDSVEIYRQTGSCDCSDTGLLKHAKCNKHNAGRDKGTVQPDDKPAKQ